MSQTSPFKIAIAAVSLLAFQSCGNQSAGEDAEPSPPGASNDQAAMITANITDLVEHDGGTHTYQGDLFSGRAVELSADGTRLREDFFWDGYRHGSSREFYEDGSNKSDTRYEKGVANGLGFEWDEEGNRVEVVYKDGAELQRGKLVGRPPE
jgi:hypothetical protein